MILYGAERETPINVNGALMECLSQVILGAPYENEDEIKAENATPVKVRRIGSLKFQYRLQEYPGCNSTFSVLKWRTSQTCVASSTSSTAAQFT